MASMSEEDEFPLKSEVLPTKPGSSQDQPQPRRRRSMTPPLYLVFDLRIVVLGKISSEISRVGNFILGRAAFDTEAPPPTVEQHSERSRGRVETRYITVINTPHLFDPQLTEEELNQRVRESIFLCDPGPHVIVLVLHPDDFTNTDRMRVHKIFSLLCEETHKHTLVLTTHNLQSDTNKDPTEESVSQIITDCSNRHVQFSSESSCSSLVEMMEKMDEDNGGSHLKWEDFQDTTEQLHEEPATHEESELQVKKKKSTKEGKGIIGMIKSIGQSFLFGHKSSDVSERLNLVVCGSDAALKSSISDIILGERRVSPESSSECVRRDGEVCGYQITLVEIPALISLSEEEVMQETLRCVSLCDPGVHAFLLIIPVRPLTDEDKGEIEKIQRYFESKVTDNMIVVFTAEKTDLRTVTDFIKRNPDMKNLVTTCKDKYRIMKRDFEPVGNLLTYIKKQNFMPYSLQMYVNIREERIRRELENKIQEMEKTVRDLKNEIIQTNGGDDEDSKSLRIVLTGKTGNGKSATGNTILGREEFTTEASADSVTTVCQKAVAEVLGKSVTVVDTPGLFDTTLSNELVQQEIVKCISLLSPGPHAFIIVLSVGRQTEEELKTLDLITKIFGPKAAMFSIVLFTRGDDLKKEDTIQKYIERSKSGPLKKLIRDCGDRLLVFNNKETKDQSQVSKLLQLIEKVIKSNNSHFFTNSMFEEAEMSIEKKVQEILKERQKEIEAEKMKLESKYNTEIKELKKMQEDEKLKADLLKLQMEEIFREKEEALKKEFEEKEKAERKKWEQEDISRSEEMKKQMDTWKQKIEGLESDNKKQRAEFEQQLKDRDEEDKKREDQYKRDRESLENEQKRVMEELKKRQNEDLQRRDQQESRKRQEEEEERSRWERRIKEAEHERKEIQEDLKCKQREWEEEKKRQMKEQEKEDQERKCKHAEELKAKEEEQDKMREKFEKEREEEKLKEEKEKLAERRKREQREREYEKNRQAMEAQMKKQYEKLEDMRQEEWERRKQEDDKRIEEERQRLQKLRDEMDKQQEEEIKEREREDEERREREEKMKKEFDQKMEEMKIKYDHEAREQAEKFNDFNEQKIKEFQELTKKHQKEYEILERLYKLTDGKRRKEINDKQKELDEIKELQKECENHLQKQLEIKKLLEELENELGIGKIGKIGKNEKRSCVIL